MGRNVHDVRGRAYSAEKMMGNGQQRVDGSALCQHVAARHEQLSATPRHVKLLIRGHTLASMTLRFLIAQGWVEIRNCPLL